MRLARDLATGNKLFRQVDGIFKKVSGSKPPALQVARTGWSWGGQFGDFDNDGFLDLFGRPPRESVCECERTDNLSLGQALNLVNGQTVADALESDEGALAEIARFVPDDGEALEELWLRFLGRPPTAEERQEFLPALNAMLPENLAALDRPLVDEFARQQAEWEAGIPKVDWLSVQDGEQRLEGGSEVERLEDGAITRLTTDGSDTLSNGTFDWVYEEEWGLRDGFRWSPDGERLAFWQIDAAEVGQFSLVDNEGEAKAKESLADS